MSAAPAVLVIAGSDSSGGAGLTRDLQVLAHLGVPAVYAVTAVTAQSNIRVAAVHHVPPAIIAAQMATAFETAAVAAIKVGMLGTSATVAAVAASLPARSPPLVLDPVLLASSGGVLLDEAGRAALVKQLLPRVTLLTPNIPEAAMLLDESIAASAPALIEQARRLLGMGPRAVLLKGGHGTGSEAVDYLVEAGSVHRLTATRIGAAQRGTGCALASAVAAGLAQGEPLLAACQKAKEHVRQRLLGLGPGGL